LVVKIICVGLGHLPQLLWLVLVQLECLLVQRVLDGIELELLVLFESMKMRQRLRKSSEVVVDLKASPQFRQLLQLAKEGEIFSGVLGTD